MLRGDPNILNLKSMLPKRFHFNLLILHNYFLFKHSTSHLFKACSILSRHSYSLFCCLSTTSTSSTRPFTNRSPSLHFRILNFSNFKPASLRAASPAASSQSNFIPRARSCITLGNEPNSWTNVSNFPDLGSAWLHNHGSTAGSFLLRTP